MRLRKRITMQLTPLLDLMMTVLFVQSILLSGAAIDAESAREAAVAAKQQVAQNLEANEQLRDRLDKDKGALAKERDELRASLDRCQNQLDLAQQEQKTAEENAEEAAAALGRLGTVAREVFDIDAEAIEKLTANMDQRQADRITEELERIKESSPDNALKQLMKLDEMQKNCTFYFFYIDEASSVILTVEEEEIGRFFVEATTHKDKVRNQYDDLVRKLEEPKSLTLVVLSDASPDVQSYRVAWQGLKDYVNELNSRPNSRSNYQLTDWGTVPGES